jgi:uncharacterized membrane protein
MNDRRAAFVQAVRGPILLSLIGVLFAMHQAGVLHFSQTWPLIIIAIGVLKLIERVAMPQSPAPPVGGPLR